LADRSFVTANGQHVDAPLLEIVQGHDIEGKRFGLLLALRPVARSNAGNRWLFQCDCGRYATRTVGAVNRAVKTGGAPACAVCNLEAQRGHFTDARSRRVAVLVARFRRFGDLYSVSTIDAIEDDIRRACAERLYVTIDEPDPRVGGVLHGFSLADAIDMQTESSRVNREYESSHAEIADDLGSWKASLPDIIAKGIARKAGAEAAGAHRG
jgi:hypothetical protein